ncbi:FAD-dependent monooxygenase [Bacillus sonorensis]|uniref:FAD-binding monooxygenase n=2 Tax=Bacillus sonorensis TaxID=119858 RepID=M5PCE4_9BACI|nr:MULTISPECIES: FAD-dependent monooxygenase [Bacillus]TWK73820.1 Pentachlorophenol 4-monooxygenase [Bacillus paralicheniformis]ASB91130.1 3-(3-hydroxy-phenyl)propanoic acid hydroxylase [Bacillus sonorensis]EME72827.1 FAD-binding monooxygenase [Bacillus sonorensis L12]MCY8034641.1 FAD-dependent monooxygenase [Bacillus sonorensis]MCY8563088.1 FAD-dependent monooxygenase [Bacillus sonorensis]
MNSILITGAGPTGLVLALYLARRGVPLRIIDKNSGPGRTSRAMAVHARTLEFYRQLDIADEAVAKGIKVNELHIRGGSKEKGRAELGDMGGGLSPYPFVLSFAQDEHEQFLLEKLKESGIEVEWETELSSFIDEGGYVAAELKKNGKTETVKAAFLCGCDGAHSTVRRGLGLDFHGGTYEHTFYVADAEASGDAASKHDLNMCLGEDGFCIVFPVRSTGLNRFIGILPPALEDRGKPAFEDVAPFIENLLHVKIHGVNWFSTYRVHHRVAGKFRKGRVFILGDAGHIHSPVGGQGMNTGIGDAVNLAWKLAAVLHGRANEAVLDSYETERRAFARQLVNTTDKAFHAIIGQNLTGRLVRTVLIPHVAPFLLGFSTVKKAAFNTVSQIRIHYRDSALSVGKAGKLQGGDRLPWVSGDGIDNFAPLISADWQIHIYGEATEEMRETAGKHNLALYEFKWNPACGKAGFLRNTLYLVRPDGHIGLADSRQDIPKLSNYLSSFGIGQK